MPRRSHYWILLSAAYKLVSSDAKCQINSDQLLRDIGKMQLVYVHKHFYKMEKKKNWPSTTSTL